MADSARKCPSCLADVEPGSTECPLCGKPLSEESPTFAPESNYPRPDLEAVVGAPGPGYIWFPPGKHKASTALFLSILLCAPGGAFYNRQWLKGIVILVAMVAVSFVPPGYWVYAIWPVVLIDTYMIAQKLQRGIAVRPWQCF